MWRLYQHGDLTLDVRLCSCEECVDDTLAPEGECQLTHAGWCVGGIKRSLSGRERRVMCTSLSSRRCRVFCLLGMGEWALSR